MPSLKDFAARLPGGAARAWAPLLGEATEAKGAIYARNTCPHCSSRLAKLPVRSMKCPSCQQPIVRIRGDDYVVYLLREEDAGPLRKEMDDHWALTRGWSEAGGRWDPEAIRRMLVEQVTGRVRWRESMEWLAAEDGGGVTRFAEAGAGKVLTGMAKRIAPDADAVALNTPADLEAFAKSL